MLVNHMHVVMLSDSETSGGAAIAASRLAEALIGAGNEVTRIVFNPDGDVHAWDTVALRLHRREDLAFGPLRSIPLSLGTSARMALVSRALDGHLKRISPDIINIHNFHGAEWSPGLLDTCMRHAPTAWTLHDAWSFTGHCAYFYDCDRFIGGCGSACPRPDEYPPMPAGKISSAWARRKAVLSRHPGLAAVTPSKWLAGEAARGLWKGHRIDVIPNSLPLGVYRPVDKNMAREALEVDGSTPVLISVAEYIDDRRKGGHILVEALRRISGHSVTLITFGRRSLRSSIEGVSLRQLGYVDPERIKVLAYNAADLMVHPAPVDNLPNVVMEAIACGIPVVGFPIGGVPEMVRPGTTGWLAKDVSAAALAGAIDAALATHKDLHGPCRHVAEAEYGQALQAKRYVELFESMRNTGGRPR